jgi:hypothetical protein
MFCPKCGTQNDDNAYRCVKCGETVQAAGKGGAQIPNYLVQAILLTIFCCLPFGIVAIVYAAQVNGKIQTGDLAGAQESSKKAKFWSWMAFGFGLGIGLIWTAITVISIVSSMGNM